MLDDDDGDDDGPVEAVEDEDDGGGLGLVPKGWGGGRWGRGLGQ